MATGDDRYQPSFTAAPSGSPMPKLSEVQEEFRKVFEFLCKLEGRLGDIALRDDVSVLGGVTTTGALDAGTTVTAATAMETGTYGDTLGSMAPAVSTAGAGRIYFDSTLNKYRVSQNAAAYVDLIGSSITQCCRVYNSANQSLVQDTETTLAFDSENFDTDGMHDVAVNNSRITFQTAGKYSVGGLVEISNTDGETGFYSYATIRLNGLTDIGYNACSGIFNGRIAPVAFYEFAIGDYVEMRARQYNASLANEVSANSGTARPAFWAFRFS